MQLTVRWQRPSTACKSFLFFRNVLLRTTSCLGPLTCSSKASVVATRQLSLPTLTPHVTLYMLNDQLLIDDLGLPTLDMTLEADPRGAQ
jgi:hypothetical protein